MSTSAALFVLASISAGTPNRPEVSFQNSYLEARQLSRHRAKPIAVLVGSGSEGWEKVSKDGTVDHSVRRLLSENYVCVYIDRTDDSGKRLASEFEMPEGPGIIISNRDGEKQAFRHHGTLTNDVPRSTSHGDVDRVSSDSLRAASPATGLLSNVRRRIDGRLRRRTLRIDQNWRGSAPIVCEWASNLGGPFHAHLTASVP
jgi:hypothetical protein